MGTGKDYRNKEYPEKTNFSNTSSDVLHVHENSSHTRERQNLSPVQWLAEVLPKQIQRLSHKRGFTQQVRTKSKIILVLASGYMFKSTLTNRKMTGYFGGDVENYCLVSLILLLWNYTGSIIELKNKFIE